METKCKDVKAKTINPRGIGRNMAVSYRSCCAGGHCTFNNHRSKGGFDC